MQEETETPPAAPQSQFEGSAMQQSAQSAKVFEFGPTGLFSQHNQIASGSRANEPRIERKGKSGLSSLSELNPESSLSRFTVLKR
jgi:hypothetical protein